MQNIGARWLHSKCRTEAVSFLLQVRTYTKTGWQAEMFEINNNLEFKKVYTGIEIICLRNERLSIF